MTGKKQRIHILFLIATRENASVRQGERVEVKTEMTQGPEHKTRQQDTIERVREGP